MLPSISDSSGEGHGKMSMFDCQSQRRVLRSYLWGESFLNFRIVLISLRLIQPSSYSEGTVKVGSEELNKKELLD